MLRVCLLLLLFLAATPLSAVASLLPIFFMHGVNQDRTRFDILKERLKQIDPNSIAHFLHFAENEASWQTNMWKQGDMMMKIIRSAVTAHPTAYAEGYTLVCHSQGALLCRTVVQRMDDHKVHTLVSLAGPQRGIYGIPKGLHSNMILRGADVGFVHTLVYSSTAQDSMSMANYWHDPRVIKQEGWFVDHPHRGYMKENTFLPVLNNEPERETQGPGLRTNVSEGQRYKANFLRLRKAVFACGSLDDWIIPWVSGCFSFYGQDAKTIVPLQNSALWQSDHLGLKTLNDSGRLELIAEQGVCHGCWMDTTMLSNKYILAKLPRSTKQSGPAEPAWSPTLGATVTALSTTASTITTQYITHTATATGTATVISTTRVTTETMTTQRAIEQLHNNENAGSATVAVVLLTLVCVCCVPLVGYKLCLLCCPQCQRCMTRIGISANREGENVPLQRVDIGCDDGRTPTTIGTPQVSSERLS